MPHLEPLCFKILDVVPCRHASQGDALRDGDPKCGERFRLAWIVAHELNRMHSQCVQDLGREPNPEEIAEKMELPLEKVRKVLRIAKEPISLETPISDGRCSTDGYRPSVFGVVKYSSIFLCFGVKAASCSGVNSRLCVIKKC